MKIPAHACFKRGRRRRRHWRFARSHLELSVLLLEVLVFVRVAVWKLVDLDAVLLDLLADLRTKRKRG